MRREQKKKRTAAKSKQTITGPIFLQYIQIQAEAPKDCDEHTLYTYTHAETDATWLERS